MMRRWPLLEKLIAGEEARSIGASSRSKNSSLARRMPAYRRLLPFRRRGDGDGIKRMSVAGERLEQRVEVFKLGVFNDDFAASVVVFNLDFEAKGSL